MGRNLQFGKRRNGVELVKFSGGYFPNVVRANASRRFRVFAVENIFRACVFEGLNHIRMIARKSCYFKTQKFCTGRANGLRYYHVLVWDTEEAYPWD